MDETTREGWAKAFTTAGWLLTFGYLAFLTALLRRAAAVSSTRFEDGVWGQRIEVASFAALPQNLVTLVPAAIAATAAAMLISDRDVRVQMWLTQLVRVVAGLCYVAITLAVLGILDVFWQTVDPVGGFSAILNRLGGVLMSAAIIRVCLEAEQR